LELLPVWSQEELIRLAPLPSDCGLRLAAALDSVLGGKAVCKIAVEDPDSPRDVARRKRYAKAAADQLLSAQREFAYALVELKEATQGIVR
jgi:putative heme iron utilization protein